MKKIAILGSTGSIGTQSLEVIRSQPDMEATVLAAGSNVELLEKQIREFHPKLVCVYKEDAAKLLKQAVSDLDVTIVSGMDGLIEAAAFPETQIVVTAVVGMIGIRPTIAAIKAGKDIALANKETLVTAGHLIIPMIKQYGVRLLPVDSEHSAIFQSLMGSSPEGSTGHKIDKILLTASGGPFRGWTKEQMKNIRPEDALKHPNWVMGRKITIDSSTMVNKGLEVMEAKWLFGVEYDQVQVVIQPQSVIHSMVQFEDGAIIAQLGTPDMKLPTILQNLEASASLHLILKTSLDWHLLIKLEKKVETDQQYTTQLMSLLSAVFLITNCHIRALLRQLKPLLIMLALFKIRMSTTF